MPEPKTETKKPETKKPANPDTPSGKGLDAAEGKSGAEAADAYQAAKKEARWG